MPHYVPTSTRLLAELAEIRQQAGRASAADVDISSHPEPSTMTGVLRTLTAVSSIPAQGLPVRWILTMLLVAVLVALLLTDAVTGITGPMLHQLACHLLPQSSSCTTP